MAPKQLQGTTKDERTDIYSLGAMLYTILNPDRLKGKNLDQRLEESRSGVLTDLDQSDLPVSLKLVVAKAMALRSIDRYSSVEDLKNDVQRFLNSYPKMAQKAGFITQLPFLCTIYRERF